MLRTQPAQSPDFNVNDLALFRALDVSVRKRRREMKPGERWDKARLAKDVMRQAFTYPAEQLERMWAYKEKFMAAVIGCMDAGGDDYPRHM